MTMIVVAGIGVVINTATALMFASGRHGDLNIRAAFLHMAADAVLSLGVVIGGIGILMYGWQWLDPVISLIIVAAIVWGTWDLLRESLDLAVDAVPRSIEPAAVTAWLSELPGVTRIHDLHIWAMSTTEKRTHRASGDAGRRRRSFSARTHRGPGRALRYRPHHGTDRARGCGGWLQPVGSEYGAPGGRCMSVSIFDLFTIGIGPSSSHTVGPMRAAARFATQWLERRGNLEQCVRVRCELFGSLAHTGRGHGTDRAVILGLEGASPETVDIDGIEARLRTIRADKSISLLGRRHIAFDEKSDLAFNKRQKLPHHSNGMRFTAFDVHGTELATRDYYSVGGGFVVNVDEAAEDRIVPDVTPLPHPFASADELLALCQTETAFYRGTDVGKRAGLAQSRGNRGWSPTDLAGYAGLCRTRHACPGCAARWTEGRTARTRTGC